MQKPLWMICALLLTSFGSPGPLGACGDKFIGAAHGTRFQQAPAGRHESVLVFVDPDSDVPAALAKVQPDIALQRAGYRPTLVDRRAEFDEKLRQGRWDLVVVGVDDVAAATHAAGRILPVALSASRARLELMRKAYPVVLTRAPSRDGFVHAVTEALASPASKTN